MDQGATLSVSTRYDADFNETFITDLTMVTAMYDGELIVSELAENGPHTLEYSLDKKLGIWATEHLMDIPMIAAALLGGRWPLGEGLLLQALEEKLMNVDGGPELFVLAFFDDVLAIAKKYQETIIKGPWPELEVLLIIDAL